MTKVRIRKGKFERLQACADERGVIAAVAIDQRSSLKKSIRNITGAEVSGEALAEFKARVSKVLTQHTSAILLDPEYGLAALRDRAPGSGAMLSYEQTGFDPNLPNRLPALLPEWSARRLVEVGTDAVKILLYYNAFDSERVNGIKRAFVERVGDECATLDVPFFLEPLAYDNRYDQHSVDFARLKPQYVAAMMEEFSRPRFGVDILKVEVPVNMAFVAGTRAYAGGEVAYERAEAMDHFRAAAAAAKKPFLYLSAGVDDAVFRETLELAGEAGVPFCGVLCGRATWKGGIEVFATQGPDALEVWLQEQGVANIQSLNQTVRQTAHAWYTMYGGQDNIEIAG